MIVALALAALAQEAPVPVESRYAEVSPEPADPRELDVFALFQVRTTASDLDSTNPLLDGQVVGALGGLNGVVASREARALYTEQRTNAFFTWRPGTLDGDAALTAAFELDWAFGDRAYGTGGNLGGGFGADQVNLQTRRLHASFFPRLGRHDLHIAVGLQFVGDSATDPTKATPDQLLRSGGRLMFWGSEAAGATIYGHAADDWGTRLRYRLGAYTLVEQGLASPDDAWLAVADFAFRPTWATDLGLHAWYVQDRTGGTGGGLGIGPASDLWILQGGPDLDPYDGLAPPPDAEILADLVWLGADAGYNADLVEGSFGAHGVAIANFGRIYAPIAQDDSISGFLVDAEARLRWAAGDGSVLRAEALWASGGGDDPGLYNGPITGNAYGVAGAVWSTHGALLLHPDPGSINRMVSVVHDVSGGGRGLVSLSTSAGWDPIPGRMTVQAGAATALTGAGESWGTEINGRVTGEPLLFARTGVAAAVVSPGSAAGLNATPWTVLGTLDWLVL